ncbi:hypothetical protein D9V32_07980 [Mycetocola tolaasinivorans]|uniref:FHA domain-containing protein n=1 Tax=Mycetocola tolaasinivorans TaxID=76635 RepID=A0A3L7A7F7_9MICO|nr:FHA domain-containing protein [Mycetocola tolaasinivorans]RLP76084.1 hypothetical protein D9V32_07980 [Mycetocola tolaasinivorans]
MEARHRVILDSGERFDVARPTVLGRGPEGHGLTESIDNEQDPQLIRVDDPDRSISRTHLILGVYDGELWAADTASGNGSVLVYPDGNSYPMAAWTRYVVDPGSTIRFGDRWLQSEPL